MNLRTLRYFIAIADGGSLTAAAAAIPIAQPALTRQMRELETEMGVQLLQRMPRGVRLTQAGVTFYESAQRILAESMRLRQRLSHEQSAGQSTVVLGVSPTLARVLLPQMVRSFNYPRSRLAQPIHFNSAMVPQRFSFVQKLGSLPINQSAPIRAE